jgi:hypothetical protein
MNQNYTPMTEETRKLFSQLVDVNWEIKLHQENNQDQQDYFMDLIELKTQYHTIETKIIQLMGHDEFENFMKMGARMFAQ